MMDARPEPTQAPNGVELRAHRLAAGTVRAEIDARYLVDDGVTVDTPGEVMLDEGTLWVAADPGGPGWAVSVGRFRVLVERGAAVFEAGYSGEALVLVTAGRATITGGAGDIRLRSSEVGVLGADGTVDAVDEVSEDELGSDPWVVANRSLDAEDAAASHPDTADRPSGDGEAEVARPETDLGFGPGADPSPTTSDEASPEGIPGPAASAPTGRPADRIGPDPAAVVATVLGRLRAIDERSEPPMDGATASRGSRAQLGEGPYADDHHADDGGRRRAVRVLEAVLLTVVVVIAIVIIAVYNRKDSPKAGPPSIATAASVIRKTSTVPATPASSVPTTEKSAAPSTTSRKPAQVRVRLSDCARVQGTNTLLAKGVVDGGGAPSKAYRITVAVSKGSTTFGRKTTRVSAKADGKSVPFQVSITVIGNTQGAQCAITEAVVS